MAFSLNPKSTLSEIVCGPCNQTRIISQANIHCPVCQDVFCYNCCKIHKMKACSRNHNTLLLRELDSSTLKNIAHRLSQQFRTTRTSRRFGMHIQVTENVDSKSQYIDRKAVTHDHENTEMDNEMFCAEHMIVFCDQCCTSHSQCHGISSLEDAATAIRNRGEFTNLINKYKTCNIFASILFEDRQTEVVNLTEAKKILMPQVKENQNDKEKTEDDLENKKDREFNAQLHDKLEMIKSHKEMCTKIQTLTQRAIEDLHGTSTQPVKAKIVKKYYQLKQKYPVYENYLKEIYDETRNYKFQCQSNAFITSIPVELRSLDIVHKIIDQKRLPPFLSTEPAKSFDEKGLKRNKSIRLWGLGIYARAGITALKCTAASHLVAVNRTECEVRIFNIKGWTLASRELSSLPWDLNLLSDTGFIVTLPGEHKIIFLKFSLSDQSKLAIEKELDVTEECWGIEAIGTDKFVGTFRPWTREASIKTFNSRGEIETVVRENGSGDNIFRAPQHIISDRTERTIYVSDSGLNAIVTLTYKGEVLSVFNDPLLDHPTGMTLDFQGNLYVCGKNSENIVQIPYTSGKEVVDILHQNYAVRNPRAMCFHSDGLTLLVVCSGKAEIFKFKLS